ANIRIGIQYLEAWLGGLGCVPLYNLMEDAATAEISRSQVWQWLKYGSTLTDGRQVTTALFDQAMLEEQDRIEQEIGSERYTNGHFPRATELFRQLVTSPNFVEFLTLPAYQYLS
ncbi:MAG: malate synthase A, partial [Chloroflexota bacterium]